MEVRNLRQAWNVWVGLHKEVTIEYLVSHFLIKCHFTGPFRFENSFSYACRAQWEVQETEIFMWAWCGPWATVWESLVYSVYSRNKDYAWEPTLGVSRVKLQEKVVPLNYAVPSYIISWKINKRRRLNNYFNSLTCYSRLFLVLTGRCKEGSHVFLSTHLFLHHLHLPSLPSFISSLLALLACWMSPLHFHYYLFHFLLRLIFFPF